jgi:hypothetical protein
MIRWWMSHIVTAVSRNARPRVPTDGMIGTSHRSSTPYTMLAPMAVARIITVRDAGDDDAHAPMPHGDAASRNQGEITPVTIQTWRSCPISAGSYIVIRQRQ